MTPIEVGHVNSGTGSSRTITVANAPGAGVPVSVGVVSPSRAASGVTDSRGNTYTLINSITNSVALTVWLTDQSAGALQVGDTLTISFSASTSNVVAVSDAWPGYTATTDSTSGSATSGTTSTTARDAGSTTTTNATDLIVGYFSVASAVETSLTPSTGYLAPSPAFYSSTHSVEREYQEVTSAGAYDPTGTGGVSGRTAGISFSLQKAAGGAVNSTLVASAGSMAITGAAITPPVARKVPLSSGSMAITGAAAGLVLGHRLTASPGSYSLTGSPITPKVDRKFSANAGSYAITGAAAKLPVGRKLSLSPGSYVITGDAATLVYTPGSSSAVAYSLVASAGAMAITGTTATTPVKRNLVASPGSVALTGSAATLPVGHRLTASPASLAISGKAITTKFRLAFTASPGAVAIAGADAGLAYVNANCPVLVPATTGTLTLTGANTGSVSLSGASVGSVTLTAASSGSLTLTPASSSTLTLVPALPC